MAEELTADVGWIERPVDELADRYASFYNRLTELHRLHPDHAAQITSSLVSAEQMPRFEPMLPEIELADTIEFDIDDEDDIGNGGPGSGPRPSWRGRAG